jgi:hypothetical protein
MWHFAGALVEALRPGNEPDVQTVRHVRLHLNQGLSGLTKVLEFLRLGKGDRLCILVDQFEEVFQYTDEGCFDEVDRFVRLLLAIREPSRGEERPDNLAIVLTMRSDYLGDCTRFDGLPEAVNATQYLVVPMAHDELVDAICQPALLPEFGGSVDLDVAEALIRDTNRDPDQLPLIQHALAYMWLRARVNDRDPAVHITLAHYRDEKVKNAANALSNHADEALKELEERDKNLRQVTEHVFRALTDTDAAGRAIRRRMPKPALVAETAADEKDVDAVIQAFARPERSFLYVADS